MQGGVALDPPYEAQVIISDSDDVYGLFSIDDAFSYIDVTRNNRYDVTHLKKLYATDILEQKRVGEV